MSVFSPINLPVFDGEKDKNDYRVMASKADAAGFSTVIREYADKTVMLRTKGGMHQVSVNNKEVAGAETAVLEEKDYALREYFTPTYIGQIVKCLKKIILVNNDTPITFEEVPISAIENEWYRFETIKTVDGIFDVVIPIAKKARYGFPGLQIDIVFGGIASVYGSSEKTVLSEQGFTFVSRTPVKEIAVKIGASDNILRLKEPINTTTPIQAY